ncbi:DUF421 domain-containing protein [Actinomadura xylanilytica]|uniref:DUF421 domain-containing protein n=1 Tax=Actinomadura xylanilytica TaxID=887459 RepID=UPI00255AAA4A|nr:YetF domain-containing protein [Actinomadura xylanilytica]MDL4770871.1 DUF421 domain-containing protein [Actinomadura xylanilytica]
MWHDLFSMGIPVDEKIVRTVGVFLAMVVLLRLAGKRELAQLNGFDFVVMLLLSNVVQNAIIGPDNSLWGGVLGAAVLVAANSITVRVAAWMPALGRVVRGRPSVLARDGEYDHKVLTRLGMLQENVDQAIQEQGGDHVNDTRLVTLEPGGALLVRLTRLEQSASYGDITDLRDRLDRIERHLEALAARRD